jgi:hypothetical protein
MEWRDITLFLHISGAGIWLGANVIQAIAPRLATAQGREVAAGWMRIGALLGTRLYMPVGLLVLASGIVLVLLSDGAYSFGSLFVTIGMAVVVIGALLGSFVFAPGGERAAEAIEAGDQSSIAAATGRLARFGILDTFLLLFVFMVMILRLE